MKPIGKVVFWQAFRNFKVRKHIWIAIGVNNYIVAAKHYILKNNICRRLLQSLLVVKSSRRVFNTPENHDYDEIKQPAREMRMRWRPRGDTDSRTQSISHQTYPCLHDHVQGDARWSCAHWHDGSWLEWLIMWCNEIICSEQQEEKKRGSNTKTTKISLGVCRNTYIYMRDFWMWDRIMWFIP